MQPNNSSAYLIIRQGQRWTDVFRLNPTHSMIIGRASSNEIPVADERSSRRHAEVYFEDGHWKVKDLGSRNGTLVDGVKITEPHVLSPGNQICVASCRLTFTATLDEVVPPLDEEPTPQSTHTQTGIPAITHRQSKSCILDPATIGMQPPGTTRPKVQGRIAQVVDRELLQLAFDMARESSPQSACEMALDRLMKSVGCHSGGVLRVDPANKSTASSFPFHVSVWAALQREGKAYHPAPDQLLNAVMRDDMAVLARNVHSDTALTGGDSGHSASSHILKTSSVIVAPMRSGKEMIGFVHLYSREGEDELTPDSLEVAIAIAEMLSVTLENLQRNQTLESKLKSTRHRISELEQQLGQTSEWVGSSASLQNLLNQAKRVGPTQAIVLIRGESGAGKELVARAIHDFSPRAQHPFVAINCAALTPTLLESELFGHEKGAFTGATERKIGKFEQAHGGTIMLDELGEMSMEIQAKFLRVLEGKAFERVGGNKPIQVDVRVIAATNRDLEQAVKVGEFRSDLYFRLRVIELRVPPLRERPEDVVLLAEHFLKQFRKQIGQGPEGFSERALSAMKSYQWPGNVRELRNAVERAVVLAPGPLAEPEDLALSYLQVPGQETAAPEVTFTNTLYQEKTIDALEQEHIEATLAYTGGQKNRAAAILGIERSTLDRKLKRFSNS